MDFTIALFLFIHIITFTSLMLYFMNREVKLIKQTQPILTCVFIIFIWLFMTLILIRDYDLNPFPVIHCFIQPYILFSMIYRIYTHIKKHSWDIKMQQAHNTPFHYKLHQYFHQYWLKSKKSRKSTFSEITVRTFNNQPNAVMKWTWVINCIIIVIASVLMTIFYVYNVQYLLFCDLLLFSTLFIINLLGWLILPRPSQLECILQSCLSMGMIIWMSCMEYQLAQYLFYGMMCVFFYLHLPLMNACCHTKRIGKTGVTQTTLHEILECPETYEVFRYSVCMDFCKENIMFLEGLQRLKYLENDDEYLAAKHLVNLYISYNSELELNLPNEIKLKILQSHHRNYGVFVEAEQHVKQLLIHNNLPKFLAKVNK
eukprot:NODE_492_length_6837_cov_0.395963.p2 type:complete len:371 gc:universal NODE_492_length_6837_cov_0.395963:3488-4600(+)